MCVNASVKYWKFFSRIQTSCCKGTQRENQNAIRLNYAFFFSQVNAEFKLPRSCRWNQISVLKPTGTECFNCPECPAGQGLVPQCGSRITADVSVECVHCQTGEGYSYKRDTSSCKPCTICDSNEQTISLCTASKNAVCGKCKSG